MGCARRSQPAVGGVYRRAGGRATGTGLVEALHPDDRAHTVISWDRAVDAGALFDGEFPHSPPDGLYRWFKSRAVPLRDGAGQVTKWFGTNTDIEDERVGGRHATEASRKCSMTRFQTFLKPILAKNHPVLPPPNVVKLPKAFAWQ